MLSQSTKTHKTGKKIFSSDSPTASSSSATATFQETTICTMKTKMAIHIIDYLPLDPLSAEKRHNYTQTMIDEFCKLPFAVVDIYVHTTNGKVFYYVPVKEDEVGTEM
eukprot:PhF_6_TR12647/c1_g1_i5/m.20069